MQNILYGVELLKLSVVLISRLSFKFLDFVRDQIYGIETSIARAVFQNGKERQKGTEWTCQVFRDTG